MSHSSKNNTSTNNKENGNNSRNFRPSKQRKQKENSQKNLEGNKNGEYAQSFDKIVEKRCIPGVNRSFAGCSSSSKIPSKNIKVITPTRQQNGNKISNKFLQKDESKIEFSKKKNSKNFQQQNGGKINNQNKWSNQNGSYFTKNIQNNYPLIRQSPTCLLRPLKEELKIDGKSSEFKPLLYGQFNSSPVIPPDVNCPPRRRRHRLRSSIPAEINGNTLSGNEEVFTRSLVGVILKNSLEENKFKNDAVNNWAEFLVYQDSKASFNSIIRLQADGMIDCISPGSWLLVILMSPVNYKTLNFDTILVPKKVIFCRHRFMTSCFDGQVSFFVTATLRKDIISGDKNKFVYHPRLCNLFIDKEELIDPLIKMFGNNSEKEENDIPIKIRLWCFPFIQNNNCQLEFKLKQIDERYYAKINSTENEEESNDENSDFNIGEEKQLLFSTNFCNWFSECIERFYIKNKMNNDRKIKMDKFVNLLNKKLKNDLDLPNEAKLILFGSAISGFGSNDCDLDICLINCGIDSSLNPSKSFPIKRIILSQIANILRKDEEFMQITAVLDARTPIVKFEHLPTKFNGDLSVDNTLALHNSELLKLYQEFDERVAPLGFAIKCWAKLYGINDASKGSISSYAYIIMLIYYLQRCSPPILPFLQQQQKEEEEDNNSSLKIVEGWKVYYSKDINLIKQKFQSKFTSNKQTLAELFLNFLHFYGYKFCIHSNIVQIRVNGIYDKRQAKVPMRRKIYVEDPFDLNHNLTAGVYSENLNYFIKCCQKPLIGLRQLDKEIFSLNEVSSDNNNNNNKLQNEKLKMDFSTLMLIYRPRRVTEPKKKKTKPKKELPSKEILEN
uniref:Uncharacterized protein n=2 Tax=Meloidogyne TaxID=189290 RepID=A0A6V7UQ74_MELEN|nr:unnamed protein product [Meloidogyne enterolobii]